MASISLLQTDEMQQNIIRVNESHLAFEEKIKNHPKVKTTRVLGTIFALEIKTESHESYYGNMRTKLYNFFMQNGIIMRPIGNIVYILPPYIITNPQLEKVYQTIENALEIV